MTTQRCPRREENPHAEHMFPDDDKWMSDGTCSYCGSLNPDELMRRLELGELTIGPTDKNYKVYLHGTGLFRSHRTDNDRTGDKSKHVWETRSISQAKFYFQHLSSEQQRRFIELLNEKKLKFDPTGRFYVLPFFVKLEKL